MEQLLLSMFVYWPIVGCQVQSQTTSHITVATLHSHSLQTELGNQPINSSCVPDNHRGTTFFIFPSLPLHFPLFPIVSELSNPEKMEKGVATSQ